MKIGWFYPEYLNLYGDRGNVEILCVRAKARGIPLEVVPIDIETVVTEDLMRSLDLVFMGGGPDLDQQKIYEDFLRNKGPYLVDHLESGCPGLFICGSYQLLGNYYKSADGSVLEGVGYLDLYTESPPSGKSRSIGNVVVQINPDLLNEPAFRQNNCVGDTLVGFENHGGRTYFGSELSPLGYTSREAGNNGKDTYEGVWYKNTISTYLHGPILSRNPHLADFLIAKSIGSTRLEPLMDEVIISAHEKSKKLKR